MARTYKFSVAGEQQTTEPEPFPLEGRVAFNGDGAIMFRLRDPDGREMRVCGFGPDGEPRCPHLITDAWGLPLDSRGRLFRVANPAGKIPERVSPVRFSVAGETRVNIQTFDARVVAKIGMLFFQLREGGEWYNLCQIGTRGAPFGCNGLPSHWPFPRDDEGYIFHAAK